MIPIRDDGAWRGLPADCTPAWLGEQLRRSNRNESAHELGTSAIDVEGWPAAVASLQESFEVEDGRIEQCALAGAQVVIHARPTEQ
ncbi:MAG: hypothetical protein IPN34_19820 [Planctomycetes bacterium]|nr:hypothetical protein [Planctomycetota bacterium]